MTKPIVRFHNSQTNEIVDREMNDAEFAQYQADQVAQVAETEAAAQAAATRQALLTRLGITEEEARILLGGK